MASEGNDDSDDGRVFATLVAVGITAVFGLIVYFSLESAAVAHFQNTHDLGTCIENGWFGRQYEVKCQATSSNLSWSVYLVTVAIPAVIYVGFHPVIGKCAVEFWDLVGTALAIALGLQSDFFEISPPIDRIAGSLWPVFLFLIPLELIALLIAKVYRSVWS